MISYIKWAAAGVLVVVVLAYVWTAERAKERAATYKAQLEVATATAEHNAEVARSLRADAVKKDRLLAEVRQERDAIDREVDALRGKLRDTLREASDEVQECLPVRLPGAVLDSLYGPAQADPES